MPCKIGNKSTDDLLTQQMIFKHLICAGHWDKHRESSSKPNRSSPSLGGN